MTDLSKPAAEAGHLHRSVGLTSLMFISLGSIIGSGWLLGALTAAKAAGGASLVSWLLAGVIIILLALVHAELGAAYPLAGGTARFPRLAFGTLAGFTAGWVAWLQAVTIAPIEVEAALSYLDHIWPGLGRRERRARRRGLVAGRGAHARVHAHQPGGRELAGGVQQGHRDLEDRRAAAHDRRADRRLLPRQQLHRGRRLRPVRRARGLRGAARWAWCSRCRASSRPCRWAARPATRSATCPAR